MQLKHTTDVIAETPEGTTGVKMRWLIGAKDGAPNFALRHLELAPGGFTPHHVHEWEHEVYVLAGEGVIVAESGSRPFKAGDCILVPGGEKHQFRNETSAPVEFLCIVPHPDRACDPSDPNCCGGRPELCNPTVQVNVKRS